MVIVPGVHPFSCRAAAHSTSHPSRRRLSEYDAGVVQVHGGGAHRWPASVPASTTPDGKLQARRGRVAGGGGGPRALDERAVDGPGGRGEGRLLGVGGQEAQRGEPGMIRPRVGMGEAEDGKLDLGNLLLLGGFGGRGCRGRLAVLWRDGRLAVGRRLRGVWRSLTRIRLEGNRQKKCQFIQKLIYENKFCCWVILNICYTFTITFFAKQKLSKTLDITISIPFFMPVSENISVPWYHHSSFCKISQVIVHK